jgi:hypothetical protein
VGEGDASGDAKAKLILFDRSRLARVMTLEVRDNL